MGGGQHGQTANLPCEAEGARTQKHCTADGAIGSCPWDVLPPVGLALHVVAVS
jgi:hypothetical protein